MLAKRSAREGVRRCRFAYTSTALQKMSNILSSTEYQHQSSFAARVLMILELDRTKPPRITPSGRRCRGRNTVCCKGADGRGQEGRDQGVFSQFRASCARQIRLGRGHMTFALRQTRVVVEKKTNVGLSLPHTELPFFPNWKISTRRLSVVHFMASSSSFNGSPSVETSETPSALPQRLPVNARLVWVSRKLSRRPLCDDDCPSRCRGQERRIDEPRSLPRACRLALWSAFDRPEA